MANKQSTNTIMMVRPVDFSFNWQTAGSNAFQNAAHGFDEDTIRQNAEKEFDGFVSLLKKNSIDVTVFNDTPEPSTPDSIFPNNWFSIDEERGMFLYPMFAENRRLERNDTIIAEIKNKFFIQETVDLSYYEKENKFLEGTGSMVLDRVNKIAYACLSPRTDVEVLNEFCKLANYTTCSFTSTDVQGKEIYHTNVMMCVADKYVVICLESIKNEKELATVKKTILQTNKEIIEITQQQLNCFAGNMLQVKNNEGISFLVMSSTAYNSLNALQIEKLGSYNAILHYDINTIETIGGGSVRCMMAEIF